jgi:type 1 glutamine amidotransferase
VVLVAGKKSHGPEGNRIHDYPWSARLLKALLEQSDVREKVAAEWHRDGWPKDQASLERADTIVVISDGRDGDKYSEAVHLESPERIAFVQKQADRGCGLVLIHFSTFAPDEHGERVLDWVGGYFDWETEGKRQWYSAIKTIEDEVKVASPAHPVARGVKPFRMKEEFYYDIRFRAGQSGWAPILEAPALGGRKEGGNVVAWALEREKGGGRAFATTCGHFYDNWQNDGFRKTVLNGIVWTAKLEVPETGVEAKYLERELLK